MSRYDGHFLIKEVVKSFPGNINVIPTTKENYISFSCYTENPFKIKDKMQKKKIIQFKFIDSFRFMSSSLDKLSSYLSDYPILRSCFNHLQPEKIKILTKKQIFPYEWMDSLEKLKEKKLPLIDDFYSSLNGEGISEEDYNHAKKVWDELNIKNFAEYIELYMKIDILLLADIFEEFCNNSVNAYGLDPCYYYTAAGLSWDAMLKITGVKLKLLTDIDMVLFIESGVRGGISQCSNRYAEANNQYLDNYNNNEEDKYIMYYDINNLYGWAMQQALPIGGFKWLEQNEIDNFNLNIMEDNGNKGYILEVDLDYTEELHDLHKDLPFCPEHKIPPKSKSKQKKLLTTLYNKKNYIIHYRYLKQALKHGLKITKVYKILEFDQSCWLKIYIDKNSELRAQSTN